MMASCHSLAHPYNHRPFASTVRGLEGSKPNNDEEDMVHSAYDSVELISDCPTKIEAIESYGRKLLLGCSDGSLRIYAPDSSGSDRSPTSDQSLQKEPYALERNVTGFSKKPLVSMEVLQSRELLLSLSETISFHGLPNLATIAVITKAKGANVYSWDDRRGFLCFAKQKRVCIFRHDGNHIKSSLHS